MASRHINSTRSALIASRARESKFELTFSEQKLWSAIRARGDQLLVKASSRALHQPGTSRARSTIRPRLWGWNVGLLAPRDATRAAGVGRPPNYWHQARSAARYSRIAWLVVGAWMKRSSCRRLIPDKTRLWSMGA
jgi:hypothetical protein